MSSPSAKVRAFSDAIYRRDPILWKNIPARDIVSELLQKNPQVAVVKGPNSDRVASMALRALCVALDYSDPILMDQLLAPDQTQSVTSIVMDLLETYSKTMKAEIIAMCGDEDIVDL